MQINNKKQSKILQIPKDGWEGLKENFKHDAMAGFVVFLIALPLSLGIAKASDFPPVMGILTAIIGGVFVSFFAGSKITIKGPAAGLIIIAADAVAEFGGGEKGWHGALAAVVVAGLIQILFGVFKLGKLSDFFPSAAVHGMLAAIGIIIMSKQVHFLMGVDPATLKDPLTGHGKPPLELIRMIPSSFAHENAHLLEIGLACLAILIIFSFVQKKHLKSIPAPLIVLLVAIPAGIILDIRHETGIEKFADVKVGSIMDKIGFNVDFSVILSNTGGFLEYVVMFSLIGSIESLLTAKAMDGLDPFKRKSNFNRDLTAVGVGNVIAGVLGGLPIISEVARSSANIANGARTRWANFFHGLFLVVFVLFAVSLIEMIPNTALAAMLIFVGFKLAHPKEFIHAWHTGKEQFFIFTATVIVTLSTDLLIGVATGIVLELLVNFIYSKNLVSLFKSNIDIIKKDEKNYQIKVNNNAVFSNLTSLKKALMKVPIESNIVVNFSSAKVVDHSTLEALHLIQADIIREGSTFFIEGLDNHKSVAHSPTSTRIKKNTEKL